MTDLARLELELLANARAALEPEPQDRARVRQALAMKFAAAGAVAGLPSVASQSTHPVRRLVQSHLVALGLVATVVGTGAFVAGYITGHRAAKVIVKTVTVFQPQPSDEGAARLAVPPESLKPASLTSSLDLGGTRPRAASSVAPSAVAASNSLAQELELLQRAERTIRTGNSQVALGLLSELDRKFPKGQLLEERTAARVMANCQLDDEAGARARGNAYLIAHSQSVYADRVRTLCHLDSTQPVKDSPKSGD